MIEEIRKQIERSGPFGRLFAEVPSDEGGSINVKGICGSLMAFIAGFLYGKSGCQVLLMVPDKDRAEELYDDCSLLLGESAVRLYTCGHSHAAKMLDMSIAIAQVETLSALARSEKIVVIASAEGLSVKIPSPKLFSERNMELETGKEYPFEDLIRKLSELGFERKDFVGEYGDYAVRGGILDVFPFVGDNPVRFEFWGDKIESIREFDLSSQRSIRGLNRGKITASLNPGDRGTAQEEQCSIFRYLADNALLILDEPALIGKEIDEFVQEGYGGIYSWQELEGFSARFRKIVHSMISDPHAENEIDFRSSPQPPVNGSIRRLIGQLRSVSSHDLLPYLASDTKEESDRLKELIEEELTAPGTPERILSGEMQKGTEDLLTIPREPADLNYRIVTETLHSGFIYPPASIALFTEHEVFGRLKRRGAARKRRFRGFTEKEIQQLRRNDFVVHQDYGIGKFAGLQKIKVRGTETEVMKLLYEDSDVLYVNLNFVNRVQKYSSQEGHTPKLNKLGGPDWERLKSRVRKKIKDIARDLIKLYARRKLERGFAFAPDTHWQKEMEASFLYEDTPDQAKTTLDVKSDMEQESPMDRLVCGDVGFGKTEIAVRAAFKAVMNNKQVAVLVPTTILARQHFNTFIDRIGRYSVRTELLSRFRTQKEQKDVLLALREGRVDILIGTHRLLSKDILFRDLGLLVIDEEQRFGVAAKERLRSLRASVDTLTLTATPIPRTLQFSLMGARDLSIINTPPRNRIPIETEILQFDLQVIREAVMKELHRGGQVYFVHDRVHDIDHMRSVLEQNLPKVRFHVAHGQMKGHELEKTMIDFLEKKFDVLICTKIIESGIDIPSVNTIIINRADRFGLAELYQLRGRVGRSNIGAYAYLLTPPLSMLSRVTLRRLQAIQEFTELGSGFNLAMRDLEIRGAGNLLGGEQSGFILEMGFEMYQRVVEEAVAELKEQEFSGITQDIKKDTGAGREGAVMEMDIEALIPDFYIEHDSERLDIYRRLYRCASPHEINSIREELKDRFGEYPEEVENLFRMAELKITAGRKGFVRVDLSGVRLRLSFPPPEDKLFYAGEFQRVVSSIQNLQEFRPRLKQEGKQLILEAAMPAAENPAERMDAVEKFLGGINPE